MRVYRTFFRADGRAPVMVGQGLSWRTLLFGWVGLLLHGAWISALFAGAASLCLGAILPPAAALASHLCLHVGLAAFASEIRAWELRLNGATPGPIIAGASKRAALMRLIDTHPRILATAGAQDRTSAAPAVPAP